MKNKLKNYYAPTPVYARIIGDLVLGIGTAITASEIFAGHKSYALIALCLTAAGKALTNFATDQTPKA